jgi:hypothetical protein
MDMYNKRVDELVKRDLTCDWEWLRGEIAKYGMKFYYLLLCQVNHRLLLQMQWY